MGVKPYPPQSRQQSATSWLIWHGPPVELHCLYQESTAVETTKKGFGPRIITKGHSTTKNDWNNCISMAQTFPTKAPAQPAAKPTAPASGTAAAIPAAASRSSTSPPGPPPRSSGKPLHGVQPHLNLHFEGPQSCVGDIGSGHPFLRGGVWSVFCSNLARWCLCS